MGGWGSGERDPKKRTVEATRSIDVRDVLQEWFTPGAACAGNWYWWTDSGVVTASISYFANWRSADEPWLRLGYIIEGDRVEYEIRLAAHTPHYGGRRWYFFCPGAHGARFCARRVMQLYLPPHGERFACRHCYRLTYKSSQEHDGRVSRLLADPVALQRLMRSAAAGSVGGLGLAVKVIEQLERRR